MSKETKSSPQTIKYKYIFDPNYNPIYVNGAYGGINPRGEIIVNFYLERIAIPNTQTIEVEGNQIKEELIEEREPKDHARSFVRFIESGIILDYSNAKAIHSWLGKHIESLENDFKENKEKS